MNLNLICGGVGFDAMPRRGRGVVRELLGRPQINNMITIRDRHAALGRVRRQDNPNGLRLLED